MIPWAIASGVAALLLWPRKKAPVPLNPPPTPPSALRSALAAASSKTDVPLNVLTAVAYVESRYNPAAKSPVGAMGLMQLMPGVAQSLGVADPFNPAQNALGGAKFLAALYRKYGDWDKVFAAYNWGPGNVDKGKDLPLQVQNYVNKVRAYT